MSRMWWALLTALCLTVILVSGSTSAQVGGPAESQEGDRDASSTEGGPSLGQSQQDQTKGQQQKNQEEQKARQDQKENREDRSNTRTERPFRHDRPMRIERFHK